MRKHAWLTVCLIAATLFLAGCDPRDTIEAGPAGGTTINNRIIVCVGTDGAHFECTDADGDGYTNNGGCIDSDGDGTATCGYGITGPADCDDTRRDVYPGAPELCDEVDNDCDGAIDEGIDCSCDDGNVCTTDSRSGANCLHASISGCCNINTDCAQDTQYCNGPEVCNTMTHTCAPAGDPCTGMYCDESTDACVGCLSNDECPPDRQCAMGMCVEYPCNGSDVCMDYVRRNHTCEADLIPLCCYGPNDDARYTNVFSNRPEHYHEGCSTDPVPGTSRHTWTTWYDGDCDGYRSSQEVTGLSGWDEDGDGVADEPPYIAPPPPNACESDAGVADSGPADSGVAPDTGVTTDAGPACLPVQSCAANEYWACSQCVLADQCGRTSPLESGANCGNTGDETPDYIDNDGDCYCEVNTPERPCLSSTSASCVVLRGGDCDDTQTGFANHPGATDWPGDNYDNDCDGDWLP